MSYLYDDITPVERTTFDSHLAAFGRCRDELEELRGVRDELAEWRPPQPVFAFNGPARLAGSRPPDANARALRALRAVPAWAQVAAAILVLGVSAAIANLSVHYGSDGLTIRTGWSKSSAAQGGAPLAQGSTPASSPWRTDLTAVEQQLRSEMRTIAAPVPPPTAGRDDEIMRRVRELIAASERRQGRELALSVASVVRDVNASRAGDLARIEHTLGALQTSTGAELMKQRQQMVNYLTQVSLRR